MDKKTIKNFFRWHPAYCFHPDSTFWKCFVIANVTYGGMLVLIDLLGSVMVMRQYQGFLSVDYDKLIWTARCILFTLAMSPLIALRLGRTFGFKKIFFSGALLFLTGSILTSIAPEYYSFLVCRVITALGGGFMLSLGIPIINHIIPEQEKRQPVVVAYSSISFGLGIALGMLIGGYYGQQQQWRMVFLANCYFVAPILVATYLCHAELKREGQRPYDIASFVFITCFFLSLLFIVTQAKAEWNTLGWNSVFIYSCEAIAAASFIAFITNSFLHPHPLIDLRIFLYRPFVIGCCLMLFVGFMVFGVTMATLGILQQYYGYEWIRLGEFMSLVGFTYFIVGAIPPLFSRYVNFRIFAFIGLSLVIASCFLSQSITIQSDMYQIGTIVFLRSSGVALSLGPITVIALSPFGQDLYAKASTVVNLVRMLGGVFGSAVIQLITAYRAPYHALRFGEMVNTESAEYRQYFAAYRETLENFRGTSPGLAARQTRQIIIDWINAQAEIAGILDAEYIIGWILLISLIVLSIGVCFHFWGGKITRAFHRVFQ